MDEPDLRAILRVRYVNCVMVPESWMVSSDKLFILWSCLKGVNSAYRSRLGESPLLGISSCSSSVTQVQQQNNEEANVILLEILLIMNDRRPKEVSKSVSGTGKRLKVTGDRSLRRFESILRKAMDEGDMKMKGSKAVGSIELAKWGKCHATA